MEKRLRNTVVGFICGALGLLAGCASTAPKEAESHKVVIQVSSDDAVTQTLALNNAVNLQQVMGMDNVTIEIVAYGPGLSMLIGGAKNSQRVTSLAKQDILFSACGNTMQKVEEKQGKPVVLSEGVRVVPAGVQRIMELQEQGYAYVRP
jgi:intracellular sulfur oxidation DsrE/DsrF family protein